MFTLKRSPDDETVRVYTALSLAATILDAYYKRHRLNPTDKIPSGNEYRISIDGADTESIRCLWTALMILAPNPNFSKECIRVGEKCQFNPGKEFNWRGKWSSKSLHETLFKRVLAEKEIKFDPEESLKIFGHQAPSEDVTRQIHFYIAQDVILDYFNCDADKRTVSFKYSKGNLEELKGFGYTKLASSFIIIAGDRIDTLDLKGLKAAEIFGVKGCRELVKCCLTVQNVSLFENSLNHLTIQGFKSVLSVLPKNLISLNLGNNELADFSKDLKEILKDIPSTLKSLNLSYNDLSTLGEEELMEIMKAIPLTVVDVNLSNNGLSNSQITKLQAYRKSLTQEAKNPLLESKVATKNPVLTQQKVAISSLSTNGKRFFPKDEAKNSEDNRDTTTSVNSIINKKI